MARTKLVLLLRLSLVNIVVRGRYASRFRRPSKISEVRKVARSPPAVLRPVCFARLEPINTRKKETHQAGLSFNTFAVRAVDAISSSL